MDWARDELAALPDGIVAVGLHSETKQSIQLVSQSGELRLEAASEDLEPLVGDRLLSLPFRHTHTHYKGGKYEVLVIGLLFGAEQVVVYRRLEGDVWMRPRDMFFDMIAGGRPRFSPEM